MIKTGKAFERGFTLNQCQRYNHGDNRHKIDQHIDPQKIAVCEKQGVSNQHAGNNSRNTDHINQHRIKIIGRPDNKPRLIKKAVYQRQKCRQT